MGKLSLREVMWLTSGHTARKMRAARVESLASAFLSHLTPGPHFCSSPCSLLPNCQPIKWECGCTCGPPGGFISPPTQAFPGCTKSSSQISEPSWRRWQWLTVPTGLAWILGSGHAGKTCPAWPSKSAEMLNPSPTTWLLGHPNAFSPLVPAPCTATRHLGLSCKCSAQEWKEVTRPSCLSQCETQLEPFFVPTGQSQKTKQEICLTWLFSRLPCTHPSPPKKHVVK